ncbi:class A beta-lactamase [Kribbella sp. NPDC051587]|uniref:class A beta-lactamase n=1 Tax=Kribbella sp. NPDC051587 TaxID=3364119 RepID=UPI0037B11723
MRRLLTAGVSAVLLISSACSSGAVAAPEVSMPTATTASVTQAKTFRALEQQYSARLGVYALDTGSRRTVSYRANERFAFASTFKSLACGVLLRQAKDLDKLIHYTAADLVSYSPITEKHVDTGMTLRELCDAAIRFSDNTAANLILAELGGPAALQTALRKLGDGVSRVNRNEPTLNENTPGDTRDTTTPRQLATSLQKFTLGRALPPAKQAILNAWLVGNTTGDKTIRAGVPKDWKVGDKTGTANYGGRNDVAVIWPPNRAPIMLAIMSTKDVKDAPTDDALIAAAAAAAVKTLG